MRPPQPFIDRECLDRLDELKYHVQECRTMLLFLTPRIFESPWCMVEVMVKVWWGQEVMVGTCNNSDEMWVQHHH